MSIIDRSIETQRAYTPPENLEDICFKVVKTVYPDADKDSWRDTHLDDRKKKFIVSKINIKYFI